MEIIYRVFLDIIKMLLFSPDVFNYVCEQVN